MFNSSILDVIIGLVFCFASVALFVSSINEAIASFLKLRHKTLLAGVQRMLNDPSGNGLARTLYEHALINPMALAMPTAAAIMAPAAAAAPSAPVQAAMQPTVPGWARRQPLPSYIAAKDFAHALLDIIRSAPDGAADLKADIAAVADPQLRQALQGFLARAQGNVDTFVDAVADWFDSAMDRLSGSYKRRAQLTTFLIGLVTAAGLNIDAFYVLDQLWKRPELSAAIVSPASKDLIAAAADASSPAGTLSPDALMATLNTLPVGWAVHRTVPADTPGAWLFYLRWALGVAITASAAVFGAPFWFDLLQQLIQIRGTGTKPATNSDSKKPDVTSPATP